MPSPNPPRSDVRLRRVIESDLPTFYEQQRDSEAVAMANFPTREWDAFMAHWTKILADESLYVRTVLFGREVAGHIGSWVQDGERLVGYWIGKSYWGKGIATEALSAFLDVVTARPLYAHVARHNIGSIRVLEKSGFKLSRDTGEELVFELGAESR